MLNWSLFSRSETEKLLGTDFDKGLTTAAAKLRCAEIDSSHLEIKKFFHPTITFFRCLGEILKEFLMFLLIIILIVCEMFMQISGSALNVVICFCFIMAFFRTVIILYSEYSAPEIDFDDTYRVLRDGVVKNISRSCIVRGDVILLSKGNVVPKTLRLIESDNLTVIEKYSGKRRTPISKDANYFPVKLSDISARNKKNMLLENSAITSGNALAVVVDEKMTLEMARSIIKINTDNLRFYNEKTLARKFSVNFRRSGFFTVQDNDESLYNGENSIIYRVEKINSLIRVCCLVLGTIIFSLSFISKVNLPLSFVLGACIMACSPQAMYDVCIGNAFILGAIRLRKQGVVIKNFDSAEKLVFSQSVLCCGSSIYNIDRMKLSRCYVGREFTFCTDNSKFISEIAQLMLYCSELQKTNDKRNAEITSQIETKALLDGVLGCGIIKKSDISRYLNRISEFYDINGELSSTLVGHNNKNMLIMKGRVSQLLKKCNKFSNCGVISELSENARERIYASAKGYENNESCNVIAIAYKNVGALRKTDFRSDFIFAGFMVFDIQVSYKYSKYVDILRNNGITPVMFSNVTSDIVLSDAKKLGVFGKNDNYATSKIFSLLDENSYSEDIDTYTLYMGLNSTQKMQVIKMKKDSQKVLSVSVDTPGDAFDMSEADVLMSFGKEAPKNLRSLTDIYSRKGGIDVIFRTICVCRNMIRSATLSVCYLFSSRISSMAFTLLSVFVSFFLKGVIPVEISQMCITMFALDLLVSFFVSVIKTPESIILDKPQEFLDYYKISRIIKKSVFEGLCCGFSAFISLLLTLLVIKNTQIAINAGFIVLSLSKCFLSLFCIMQQSTRKAPAKFPLVMSLIELAFVTLIINIFAQYPFPNSINVIFISIIILFSLLPVLFGKMYNLIENLNREK